MKKGSLELDQKGSIYGFIFPRYNAPRCNAAKDALRPTPEFTPRHFKQDDAERQGRDSNAERVEPDKRVY